MRTPDQYRPRKTDVVITAFALIGTCWLLSHPIFDEPQAKEPEPAPKVKPLSERLGCKPWKDGESRTATATFTEDAHGNIVGTVHCHRYKVRSEKVAL